ncbi:MAG TPA: hypothetical protein DCQ93_09645 [Bacteroidetes bacterium]|nr:hypothetical protein [Bacteroidota bacterium]
MKSSFRKNLPIILWWTAVLSASIYFYHRDLASFFSPNRTAHEQSIKWRLMIHFIAASATLFLGPLQFIPYIRNNFKTYHRTAGKIYIVGSIISALMVFLFMSQYELTGSILSLTLLASIWLFTTCAAFWFALKKNFKMHKQFMIRSYVWAFAFILIRALPILQSATGIFNFIKGDEMRLTVYEWICWIYPLIVTEFLLSWLPSIKKYSISKK